MASQVRRAEPLLRRDVFAKKRGRVNSGMSELDKNKNTKSATRSKGKHYCVDIMVLGLIGKAPYNAPTHVHTAQILSEIYIPHL